MKLSITTPGKNDMTTAAHFAYLAEHDPTNSIMSKLCDQALNDLTPELVTILDNYATKKALMDSHTDGKERVSVIRRISPFKYIETRLPFNFSWACEHIYGSGLPTKIYQIEAMRDVYDIKHVISIREFPLEMSVSGVEFHHFTVADMFPPTTDQLNKIVAIMTRDEPCLIHCHAGIGRTGTALIAYLSRRRQLQLHDAFATIKQSRPRTRLTTAQLTFLREWVS